jgi:trehalose/maltose hydrolase-like predicted phosphorylase
VSVKDLSLSYDGFDPAEEGLREALTSTGNGYLCARGAAEWEDADDIHYPGTYLHGIYNRETTILGGLPVPNEDLVNLPNWLVLKLRIDGEEAVRFDNVELLAYRHALDIQDAVLLRELRFLDRNGRLTALRSRRFVSMADPHEAGIEWTLTPENWSGRVELVSAIDGRVTNSGVARYGRLVGRHVDPVSPRTFGPEVIALKVTTRQSDIYVSEGARTRVYEGGQAIDVERTLYQVDDYIQQSLAFDVRKRRQGGAALARVRGGARPPSGGLGGAVARLRSSPTEGRARAVLAAVPHLARPAGLLAPHGRLGRRGSGARSERRGVPGACVLG